MAHRRWTEHEDERLTLLWGTTNLRALAKKFGRSQLATYKRAQRLGLSGGCPDGSEYLTHAAERSGFGLRALRRILQASNVQIQAALSRPREKANPKRAYVDPLDVDDAVSRWMSHESLTALASRVGVGVRAMQRTLRAMSIKPKARGEHWVDSNLAEQLIGYVLAGVDPRQMALFNIELPKSKPVAARAVARTSQIGETQLALGIEVDSE